MHRGKCTNYKCTAPYIFTEQIHPGNQPLDENLSLANTLEDTLRPSSDGLFFFFLMVHTLPSPKQFFFFFGNNLILFVCFYFLTVLHSM